MNREFETFKRCLVMQKTLVKKVMHPKMLAHLWFNSYAP